MPQARRAPTQAAGEAGGIIVAGLLKVVLTLLVLGLVFYEAGAITVNEVQLDDLASRAARAGASSPPQQRTAATVERAVLATLEGTGARLDAIEVTEADVTVTVSRPARVLLVDRLGPVADIAEARRTKQSAFR